MASVPNSVIKRLRDELINIRYMEVHLWSDEDLKNAVFVNGSSWFELLKWLLGELDGDIKETLKFVEKEKLPDSIKDVIIGLGFCSTNSSDNFVSGKVIVQEREEFCSMLIDLVQLKRKKYIDGTPNIDSKENNGKLGIVVDFKVFKTFEDSNIPKADIKGNNAQSNAFKSYNMDLLIDKLNKMQENVAAAEESIKKKRHKLGIKDDNMSAADYLEQLFEERNNKLERLANVASSVENLWQTVDELYKSELQALLPVEVMETIKIPALEELTEQMDCFSKLQKDLKTVKKCRTLLQDRFSISSGWDWSVKNTESLEVVDLQEQVCSVVNSIKLAERYCKSRSDIK